MKYSIKDIMAVVVVYNSSVETTVSMNSLNRSVEEMGEVLEVVVYDNSHNSMLESAEKIFNNLHIIYEHNSSNPGVSTAYNFAARTAQKLNKNFLLLLDQDTYLPIQFLQTYLISINMFPNYDLFAPKLISNNKVFSPCTYFFKIGCHKKHFLTGENSLKRVNFLNSGLLIRLETYLANKGYDERVQLYFSDFEFIDRIRRLIDKYVLIDITCKHDLSSNESGDKEKAIFRFNLYCRDGKKAVKNVTDWIQYFTGIGVRAIKLSIRFRDIKFLNIFGHHFISINRIN